MLFGLAAGPGFVDLLAGTTDFTKVIARDPLSNAHLLRFGLERNEEMVSLMDQRTDAVLSALGNIYDIVVIHCGEASSAHANAGWQMPGRTSSRPRPSTPRRGNRGKEIAGLWLNRCAVRQAGVPEI